jgi:predicted CoA-binding protein
LRSEEINSVLNNHKTVADVGLFKDPAEASHRVAYYLESVCYRFIPVKPFTRAIRKTSLGLFLSVSEVIVMSILMKLS